MTDDLHAWRTAAYKHVQERDEARAERDGAYRERAQLTALLAAIYPSTLAYNDPTAPEWAVVYVTLPTGQCSWHVAPRDVDLFAHVRRDDSTVWDGHTTAEKYQRIAEYTADTTLLTHPEALELVDELGQQVYKAEDRLAFIAEMCTAAEQDGSSITVERLRSWLAYTGCGGVIMLPETDEHPAGIALPTAGEDQP